MSAAADSVAARAGRVAVLMGGFSAERDISLQTGRAVLAALERLGLDAEPVDTRSNAVRALLDGGFDSAWIALHGRGGEDGSIQGLLEYLQLPYTGSGVAASALCLDKLRSKRLFRAAGLSTPEWVVVGADDSVDAVAERLGFPVMIKPASEGSSVGMRRADSPAELAAGVAAARAHDSCVLVERWIAGGEYTAAVLGREVLPLVHIEAATDFYDYEAKYVSEDTRYHCPCDLPAATHEAYARQALTAFDALGASGWGRVDFLVDAAGKAQFLEVNTVPGMTDHSLVPMAARQAGLDFDALVLRVLELGLAATANREKEGGDGAQS
ncbi:MAG: D-alanine--D-alanine ligase [Pseudomonadota bacterium]